MVLGDIVMKLAGIFGVMVISAALLRVAVAQPAVTDDQIAAAAIQLFDDLCITHARQDAAFFDAMKKRAKRKLGSDEYARFLPSQGQKEDYFEVPVLDGKASLIVGRVA